MHTYTHSIIPNLSDQSYWFHLKTLLIDASIAAFSVLKIYIYSYHSECPQHLAAPQKPTRSPAAEPFFRINNILCLGNGHIMFMPSIVANKSDNALLFRHPFSIYTIDDTVKIVFQQNYMPMRKLRPQTIHGDRKVDKSFGLLCAVHSSMGIWRAMSFTCR